MREGTDLPPARPATARSPTLAPPTLPPCHPYRRRLVGTSEDEMLWMESTAAGLRERLAACGPIPVDIGVASKQPHRYLPLRREMLVDLEEAADAIAEAIAAAAAAADAQDPPPKGKLTRKGKLTFPLLPRKKIRATHVELTPTTILAGGLLNAAIAVAKATEGVPAACACRRATAEPCSVPLHPNAALK